MFKKRKNICCFLIFIASIFFSSCSNEPSIDVDYSFKTAKNVKQSIGDFREVEFISNNNLDLGFYKGQVWIKLEISNTQNHSSSFIVLYDDLINYNYRFYKFDSLKNTFESYQNGIDLKKYDHRSFNFAKPNFKINLLPFEKGTFLITTSSDGRILQASPKLITENEFQSIKQQAYIYDFVFYFTIVIILLINLFYFRLIRSDIYYYYGAYIIAGCLMYLFVEGKFYRLGINNALVDHLIFIAIRIWILTSFLFALKFLEIKKINPKFYRSIVYILLLILGFTTVYQFLFYSFSISTLHQFENIIGFLWIILSLVIVRIAYKKQKMRSIYYLISYSTFLIFVGLGLIDSHTNILPGYPFFYFKIGTILEFIGFTYFITIMVKHKLKVNENLQKELSENLNVLKEKEKQLATKNTDLVSVFKLIENSFSNDSDWQDFKERFKALNPNFIESLLEKHSNLTKSEIRLLTLIKVGYSQKEMAIILCISPDSVKKARSRVRKKMNLEENEDLKLYLKQF